MTERPERTARGYRRFRCRDCGKQSNERSGGPLNHTHYFPVHVLLRLAPAPLLELLGVPEGAPWPSSAAVAVALGLPLWGLLVTGGLVAEACLEMALDARRARARRAAGPGGRPPPPQ